jgi:hypothetical protein
MKWFRTFWTNNMVDKLTLLFLSAELEMDDDDDEMNLEESVVTVNMPDRCKLMQTIFFLATLGNNILTHAPQIKYQICPF